MTTKKFTVTFTSHESTRWLEDDKFVAMQLKLFARSLGARITTGHEPEAEVEPERTGCKCCQAAILKR